MACFLAIVAVGVAARYFLLGSGRVAVSGNEPCLPPEVAAVRSNSPAVSRTPGNLKVYFDASGGMAGYAATAPNALGNFSTLAGNFVQSSLYQAGATGKVTFYKFGEYRFDPKQPASPPAVADPQPFARASAYNEADTNLADLLRWVQHDRDPKARPQDRTLSIVVTDLMLDDREAVDDFEASVGGLLRKMVGESGLAVGFLSVRVPFNGKIFVGGQAFGASLNDRPLMFLIIGDPYQVRSFYEYLRTSEAAPFADRGGVTSRTSFAIFGLEPASIALYDARLTGVSTGFSTRPLRLRVPGAETLQSFTFNADSMKAGALGGLELALQANSGVEPFEVVGSKPLWESAVWKLSPQGANAGSCKAGTAWVRVANLPPAGWKQTGQTLTYSLDATTMKRVGLSERGVYLVQFLAGQENDFSSSAAADWMKASSMSNAEIARQLSGSRTAQIGVPGLEQLRNVLITELELPGNKAIKRAAAQIIIQSE